MPQPPVITAEAFAQALARAGVIRDIHRVRRVVVDAEAGSTVRVYIERYGDERLLDVVPTLDGVEISGVPAGPAATVRAAD
jgi:hypothetical protein